MLSLDHGSLICFKVPYLLGQNGRLQSLLLLNWFNVFLDHGSLICYKVPYLLGQNGRLQSLLLLNWFNVIPDHGSLICYKVPYLLGQNGRLQSLLLLNWFNVIPGSWITRGVGGAVRSLVVGTTSKEERPPQGQLYMEQYLISLKYWPI